MDTGAGYALTALLAAAAEVGGGAEAAAGPRAREPLLVLRRALLGLDSPDRRGGRVFGLACRQLPVTAPPLTPPPGKGGGGLAEPWVLVDPAGGAQALESLPNWKARDAGADGGEPMPQHAAVDESAVGPGFALYYAAGDGTRGGGGRPLSLTLAFVGPRAAEGPAEGGGAAKVARAFASACDEHASAVLGRVVETLRAEAVAPARVAGAAAGGSASAGRRDAHGKAKVN